MYMQQRWFDARDAVQYLGLDDTSVLRRLVKQGRAPAPSYGLGPRSPRWDREALDSARPSQQQTTKLEISPKKLEISTAKRRSSEFMTSDEILAHSADMDKSSGVYFLIREGRIIYVGQSRNVYARIGAHRDKSFDRITIFLCDLKDLLMIEAAYIKALQPELNRKIRAAQS
jgi:hypothetical protein